MTETRAVRARGFTLIEVLVSVAILAGMTTLIWGSFSMTANAKRRVEEIEQRYHQIRLGMNRMSREISMAFLSKNDTPGTVNPRTMFIGQHNSRNDDLSFSSLAHVVLRENSKECDQSVIRYYAAPDPDSRSRTHLMRRESRRLGGQRPGEEGPAYVMIENIDGLHFQYFDETANEWKESWSTTSADGQPDRLPSKVRIALTVRDENNREITLLSGTTIPMRDALWFSPQ
jgi:general secretion pathway protein J